MESFTLLFVTNLQHWQKEEDVLLDHTLVDDKLWMYSFNQNQRGEKLNGSPVPHHGKGLNDSQDTLNVMC
jgi:hypothetical protein